MLVSEQYTACLTYQSQEEYKEEEDEIKTLWWFRGWEVLQFDDCNRGDGMSKYRDG